MKRFGMAVIGLGVVGRRMLEQAAHSPGIRVSSAWDLSPAVLAEVGAAFPGAPIVESAAKAINHPDVDVVYVAVPPLAHAHHVRAAIAAGKAVFCEKPLGIDQDESRALVNDIERSRTPSAVNFVFASSAAVDAIAAAISDPAFALRAVEIRTRFHQWPRDWQAGASWLQLADQGGFTREVLSHFVYLLHRLLGEVQLRGAVVTGPLASPLPAETGVSATLSCRGIPISLSGSVGGQAPDLIEARFIGATRELRLSDWYRLEAFQPGSPSGQPVPGLPADPRQATYQRQLLQLQALLAGQQHTLPGFSDALAVQTLIENLLASRTPS
jgi:predicted dehydrogenase